MYIYNVQLCPTKCVLEARTIHPWQFPGSLRSQEMIVHPCPSGFRGAWRALLSRPVVTKASELEPCLVTYTLPSPGHFPLELHFNVLQSYGSKVEEFEWHWTNILPTYGKIKFIIWQKRSPLTGVGAELGQRVQSPRDWTRIGVCQKRPPAECVLKRGLWNLGTLRYFECFW